MTEINAAYAGSRNVVSMQQDLLRSRATEIDYLNGAVVALGTKNGLQCPVNDGLTRIIKGMEAGSRKVNSEKAAGRPILGGGERPEELLDAIAALSSNK